MILAFDLATQTGWAVGAREPVMGSRRLGPLGCTHSVAGGGLLYLMDELISEHKPELILFEQPIRRIVQEKEVKGGKKKIKLNPHTLYRLGGLAFICEAVASTHGIPVKSVNMHTARAMFLKPGKAPVGKAKEAVMEGCRLRGWHVENDDESDAACIWATHARGAAGSPLFARGA